MYQKHITFSQLCGPHLGVELVLVIGVAQSSACVGIVHAEGQIMKSFLRCVKSVTGCP